MEYPIVGIRRAWFKISRIPYFVRDAITYPPRRRQVCWRLVEVLVGLLVVLYWPSWAGVLTGLVGEFLVYEFILEPLGLAGLYWERGPRPGARQAQPGTSWPDDSFWSE